MAHDPDERRFDKKITESGIRIKDENQWKVRDNVFDEVTLLALYKLANRRYITAFGGPISTGKEGIVFYGEREDQGLAIKIYMISTANFKAMTEYIDGDPRFSHVRKSRKEIIFAWTRKEFSNLKRAKKAGLPVPEPYSFDRNILLMEFLGDGEKPFPQIRDVEIPDPAKTYHEIHRIHRDPLLEGPARPRGPLRVQHPVREGAPHHRHGAGRDPGPPPGPPLPRAGYQEHKQVFLGQVRSHG